MTKRFKVGDFVVCDGCFAKILKFVNSIDYQFAGVELIPSEEKKSYLLNTIRTILTTEKHLLEIGFKKIKDAENPYTGVYALNDKIIVSQIEILRPLKHNKGYQIEPSGFLSGFCIADFRNEVNVEKYKKADFDEEKIY